MIPTTFDELERRLIDYRPVAWLGRGGFADVVLAKDRNGETVAVKLGRDRAAGDDGVPRSAVALDQPSPEAIGLDEQLGCPVLLDEHEVGYPSFGPDAIDAVLETEYRLLRHDSSGLLPHPVELLYRGGRAALVFEHVEGQSLRSLLRQRAPIASSVLLDLLDATETLSARSRIRYHGEIKPEHIIISPQKRLRLLDPAYRTPLVLAPEPLPARLLALSVTPAYNPFLLSGPSADLFAVAVVCYEVLCGRRPFAKEQTPWDWAGVVAWRASVVADLEAYLDRPAPADLVPDVPSALSGAIMQILRARGEGRGLLDQLRAALRAAPPVLRS